MTASPISISTLERSRPVEVVAEFTDYPGAQRLVDRLSDEGFPVGSLRIVGTGIRTVEQVTGRLTKTRAALLGAGSGAWFGLLIGLLLGLFAVGPAWLPILLGSLIFGAVWGALFGFFGHWATGGHRDFSSVQRLEAERYQVMADVHQAAEARRLTGAV